MGTGTCWIDRTREGSRDLPNSAGCHNDENRWSGWWCRLVFTQSFNGSICHIR
jgi:hypothetical protein